MGSAWRGSASAFFTSQQRAQTRAFSAIDFSQREQRSDVNQEQDAALDGGADREVLEAEVEDERLTVTIANPIDPDGPPTHGDGIGLRNVIGRLQLLYRGNGRLETAHGADRFEAILELPTRPEGADRSPS